MGPGPRDPLARIDAALFLLLAALLFYAIFSVPFLPTHDGPSHFANCVLANRMDAGAPLGRWLEPGGALTTQGYQYLCRPLEAALGWKLAHQALVALLAFGWAAGFAFLSRGVARRSGLALLGFATALQWQLYMGFVNFVLAAVCGMFIVGWILRRAALSTPDWIALSLALLLTVFAHPFPVAMAGVSTAAIVLLRAERREWPRLLVRLGLAGAPALSLVLAVHAPDTHPVEWRSLGDRALDLARLFAGGPAWRAWPPTLVALATLTAALVAWARGTLPRGARGLVVVSTLTLVAYALSPLHAPNWAFFSPRFLALGLPLAIAAAPPTVFDGARRAIATRVLATVISVGALAWSVTHHTRLAGVVDEVFAGLDAPLARTGPRLPLMLSEAGADDDLEFVRPLSMVLHAYTFDQGGVDPFLFATVPATDSILYVDAPEALFGNLPQRFFTESLRCAGTRPDCPPLDVQYAWFAIYGRLFEDVLVFADDPAVVATFRARGYTVDFQRGRLAILRPGRCPLAIELGAAPGLTVRPPLVLQIGHPKVDTPVISSELDVARVAAGTRLDLAGPDCGLLWLRVEGPHVACAEGERGLISLTATATATTVATCTLVQVPE